jgi:hypothetical protein
MKIREIDNEMLETYALAFVGGAQGVFKYYIRPEMTAKRAWAVLGASVALYELLCPEGEMLSHGVDKALEKHPVAVTAAIGYTALHLANLLPEEIDLFHHAANLMKGTP